jgi:hypothetical protein
LGISGFHGGKILSGKLFSVAVGSRLFVWLYLPCDNNTIKYRAVCQGKIGSFFEV